MADRPALTTQEVADAYVYNSEGWATPTAVREARFYAWLYEEHRKAYERGYVAGCEEEEPNGV